jgi:nitroreductase
MDMFDAINQQRSVKAFDPTHRFTAAEEMKLLEAAIQSPTSFNMQNWRFVVVRDTELRKQIRAAAIDQAQVTDASLLIVLTATESPPSVVTLTGSHAGNGALLGGQVTFAGQ